MSFWDRVQEVVPHTGRAWLEAVGIALVLAVLIFVVLPRLVKPRVLRWGIAAGLLFVAAWLTVLSVFFDKRVDERLLGTTAVAPAATTTAVTTGAAAPAADPPTAPTTPSTQAGPVKVTTGTLKGLAGHFGRGGASVYRLPDGTFFVRLEAIETPRAPAVFVYLVPKPGQTGPDGGVDLGALKGNQGSQNYMVPPGVDVSKYQTVLLWCRRFSTPIAAATQNRV
jgi:hypothetical protein